MGDTIRVEDTDAVEESPAPPHPRSESAAVSREPTGGSPLLDMVNQPPHYQRHPSGVETITITEHFNFCLGNAIKYIWRADYKGGIEDLKKAEYYIRREIKRRERMSQCGTEPKPG